MGIDAAVHVSRAWCARNRSNLNKGLIKLDFEKAFNSVDRTQILARALESFPGLARWTQWTYSGSADLLFGKHTPLVLKVACSRETRLAHSSSP